MFKKLVICSSLLLASLSVPLHAEDNMAMTPPKPLKNKVFEAMIGTWKGQSDMKGEKMNDTMKISWTLGHQFLLFQLKSEKPNDPKQHYEGMGLFGIDANNQVKVWWFDNWGADTVSAGTGTTSNNKLSIKDSNNMMSEERTFEIKGNEMVMHANGSMNLDNKNIPFVHNGIYKKNN